MSEELRQPDVAEALARAIQDGEYGTQSRLPSERVLAQRFRATRHGIRQAITALERNGLLRRVKNSGTFVQPPESPLKEGAKAPLRVINALESHWPGPSFLTFVRDALLEGYTRALDPTDIRMRFMQVPKEDGDFNALFLDRIPLREQGVILGNAAPPRLMRWLLERKIPFVVRFYREYNRDDLPDHHSIFVKRRAAGHDGTKYLLDLGHERIAFMGGSSDRANTLMVEGYEAAMMLAGKPTLSRYICDLHVNEIPAAIEPAMRLLDQSPRPTAIMAETDAMALGALEAAKRLGIRVPEELSIIGFNNQPESAESDPPLTTMDHRKRVLGKRVVEMLIAAASGEYDTWQNTGIDCPVISRGTTTRK
jgi:GntR family transcriptional regulator, arabinose operon transcriptional repressor